MALLVSILKFNSKLLVLDTLFHTPTPLLVLNRNEPSLLFLIATPLLIPTPKVFQILHSKSERLKLWATNVVTSNSQFTLASFFVLNLKFHFGLRFQESNKKRTPAPLTPEKTPYSNSIRLRVFFISGT